MLQITEYSTCFKLDLQKKNTGLKLRLKGHGRPLEGKTIIRPHFGNWN